MEPTTSVTASVADLLREPKAADAADRGLVHIINVGAIKEAVGLRWDRQAPLVEDFVLRSFRRTGREDDFIVRVNDADFILIQPGREALSALSRASLLMRETLSFFLGAAKSENIHISIVDRVGTDGVNASRVSGDELAAAAASRTPGLSASQDGSPPWEAIETLKPTSLVNTIKRPDGSDLMVAFYVEPVWRVGKSAVVSFAVRTIQWQKAPGAEAQPVLNADLSPRTHAMITSRCLDFVAAKLAADQQQPLGAFQIPISYGGMTLTTTRTATLADLKKHSDRGFRSRTIIEITDIPSAVPTGNLMELVAQLAPFALAVLLHTEATADCARWAGCGATGMLLTLAPQAAERALLKEIDGFAQTTRRLGFLAGLDGVKSRSVALAAWAAGIEQIAGDVVLQHCGDDGVPRRLAFRDLYKSHLDALSLGSEALAS